MTTQKKGATLVGLPDRFVAVEIETEAAPAFDAAQYSFFGDLSAADSGLEGALEDGLEAPPAEEGLSSQDYVLHAAEEEALALDEEEDLSVATLFRNQLGLGPAKTPPNKRVDPDEDAGLDALLTDPLSVARKQLQDDDYDQRGLPSELYPETMPSHVVDQPQPLFNASASAYGLFSEGYASAFGSQTGGAGDGLTAAADSVARPVPPTVVPQPALQAQLPQPANNGGAALLQMLKKPQPAPIKAMTLEELEARMMSSVDAPAPVASGEPAAPPSTTDVDAWAGAAPQQPGTQLLTRPLPGMPASGRGAIMPGPRMPMPMASGPQPMQGGFPPQMQPPGGMPPGGPQGPPPPPGPGLPSPQLLHGPAPGLGPMQMPLMLPGVPPPGGPGPGMYPLGQMIGGPRPMYNGNGLMPPPPPHHHQPGAPIMQPGVMPPPHYGPAGMYPPRGPMPPYGPAPMGMGGPGPFMHDGFPMRPMGAPPGMPVPMHGMPPRPGPFLYGPHPMGPTAMHGHQPAQQQQGPQRPPILSGSAPQHAGGLPRPGAVLGPGAAGMRPAQARPPSGAPAGLDFGQQGFRTNGAPGSAAASGPVALAAAAAAAGRAGGPHSGPGGRLGGKWMLPEDVEYVVRSMLYTVANGVPYVEDYYYQAFVHKHVSQPSRQQLSPGSFPMAAPFVPESLRELSEDQMSMMRLDPSSRAKFVEGLQGLGKIVLSNIRTPKVLMDLSDRGAKGDVSRTRSISSAGGEGATDVTKGVDQQGRGTARPLEQEPLLAARIMIEDCMNLLLDVDDIDRLANHMAAMAQAKQRAAAVAAALPSSGGSASVAAAAAATAGGAPAGGLYGPLSAVPPSLKQLHERRELLLAGINGAFRLPNAPRGTSTGADGATDLPSDPSARVSLGDGVLVRILALSKGRGVVARALLAISPPASLLETTGVAPARPQPPSGTSAPQPRSSDIQAPQQSADTETASSKDEGGGAPASAAEAASDAAEKSGAAAPPSPQKDLLAAAIGASEGAGGSSVLADAPSHFVLLWGVLRSAWMVFGSSLQQDLDAAAERSILEATSRLAAGLKEALLRLPTARDVVDAAAAFNTGCRQHVEGLCQGGADLATSMEVKLLPLAQTRTPDAPSGTSAPSGQPAPAVWLGEALAALVTRASQLGLAAGEAAAVDAPGASTATVGGTGSRGSSQAPDAVAAEWRHEYALLHERLSRHLGTLREIQAMTAASGNAEAMAVVRSLSCRVLVNAMLQHASVQQADELKAVLPVPAA